MNRTFSIAILMLLLFTSNALAGFSSYSELTSSDRVIAPIQIKNKGIYNLVVSIQFLNAPYGEKIYKSDTYEKFLRRLKVEWSGVAILQILKAKEQSISDLANLKGAIELEINKLADQLKKKYSLDNNVEVVYSLTNFFIFEPSEK